MNNKMDLFSQEEPFLSVQMVTKSFRIASSKIDVLKGVSFSARRGEWLALVGASGSGKTTLLDIVGTISRPDTGRVLIDGVDTTAMSSRQTVLFRRKKIGFVFQSYHLLPELTVLENAMLPGMLEGKAVRVCRKRAESLLERLGLSHRLAHRPNELSGGEQQRVAIARALQNEPELLLADEPTGNLDSVTGKGILEIFRSIHDEGKMTIVMVTHDHTIAALADRILELRDGCFYQ